MKHHWPPSAGQKEHRALGGVMHIVGHIRLALVCLLFCSVAASGQTMWVHEVCSHDLLISVNPSLHQRYGLSYPITYILHFPTDDTGLRAFVRSDTISAWTELPAKLPTDFFNGIDAVRFDYDARLAYVSATLSDATDDIYFRITKSDGDPVRVSYGGVAPYYDNRRGTVVIGIDDWKDYTDDLFVHMSSILRSYNLPFTAAVITGECTDSTWRHIQTQLDAGSFEAGTHTRTHVRWPYQNLDDEIGGSYADLMAHLTMPAQYRKGATQYVYSFIVPYGETSAEIEEVVTRTGYLNDRVVGFQTGRYAAWDTSAGRFRYDGTTKEMGPPWGTTDAVVLNAAFDSRIAQNLIYHLLIHPYTINATDEWNKPYFSEHLSHISNRTDLWYTTFGHLYVYRLLGDSSIGETIWPETSPAITTDPVSTLVMEGARVTFTCQASGSQPLTFQWQKNGSDIPGASGSSYALSMVTMRDSGSTFRCIVQNTHGADTSASAILSVVSAGSGSGIVSDDFNSQALNTSLWRFVDPLQDVTLTMTGGGTQDARLALSIPAGVVHDIWTEGNTAPRIMQPTANGDFEIEAKFDAVMSESAQIQGLLVEQDSMNYIRFDLVANPPRLGFFAATFTNGVPTEQVDQEVNLSAPYYIRVQRVGDVWIGSYSANGATWTEAISFTHELNVRESGAWAGNAGSPAPAFTGLIDYVFNSLSPVVDEDGSDILVAPVITSDPASVTILQGQPASFTTEASGTSPLAYRWQRNGLDISGAIASAYAISAAARSDSGATFRCIVSNMVGKDTSAGAILNVTPVFIAGISREPADTTVYAGQPAHFMVAATGTAPLSYRWQRNGTDIPDATDSLYLIASTSQADSGTAFRCIVSNIGGNDTSALAILRVLPVFAVSIFREPLDTTVFAGQPASFTVAATGTAPLSYRWQRNGTDIPDATDSLYLIASASQADSGTAFRCIVSNIGGSDTSRTALLTIAPMPVPAGVRLSVFVLLQGAMTGDSMRTDMCTNGVLPLVHPFEMQSWGTVLCDSLAAVPSGTVDWILVELRSGTADSTIRQKKAGLLQKNGMVTATDGISPLYFPQVPQGEYYIVVRHRNHLPVMSATPVGLSNTSTVYDFTAAASRYFGGDAVALTGGRYGMVAGDVDHNRGIGGTDLAFIRLTVGPSVVYGVADVDLNGIVGTEDLLLTRSNIGRTSAVP
jgi:hypothetical protein